MMLYGMFRIDTPIPNPSSTDDDIQYNVVPRRRADRRSGNQSPDTKFEFVGIADRRQGDRRGSVPSLLSFDRFRCFENSGRRGRKGWVSNLSM